MTPPPLPSPVPVEFGPHVGDWVLVAVTAAGVVASVVVAVVATRNARDARDIALAAREDEARRDAEARERLDQARAESITRAYAKHVKLIAAYARALREWLARQPTLEAAVYAPRSATDLKIDAPPSINDVRGDLEVLRMLVPEDDRKTLADVGAYLARLNDLPANAQERPLWDLIGGFRDWRTESRTADDFSKMLREAAAKMAAQAAEVRRASRAEGTNPEK